MPCLSSSRSAQVYISDRITPPTKSGFTVIECIVTILIVGLITGFSLAALQQARENARRIQCSSHLRELGSALNQHCALKLFFPSGYCPGPTPNGVEEWPIGPYSIHYQILPFLEQSSLFNSINVAPNRSGPEPWASLDPSSNTARNTVIAVFLCPSDGSSHGLGTNYSGCVGPNPGALDWQSRQRPGGGGVFSGLGKRADEIRDGFSNTVAMSERLRGTPGPISSHADQRTSVWFSGFTEFYKNLDGDELLAACDRVKQTPPPFLNATGLNWLSGGYADTLYNHVAAPNRREMDCSGHSILSIPQDISYAVVTARSNHSSSINCLQLDGSVRFQSERIQLAVWRALASRAGAEAISYAEME